MGSVTCFTGSSFMPSSVALGVFTGLIPCRAPPGAEQLQPGDEQVRRAVLQRALHAVGDAAILRS